MLRASRCRGEPEHRLRVFSDAGEVRSDWLFPLLSVGVSSLDVGWRGPLHFVHCEYPSLTFRVTEGKYTLQDTWKKPSDTSSGFVSIR